MTGREQSTLVYREAREEWSRRGERSNTGFKTSGKYTEVFSGDLSYDEAAKSDQEQFLKFQQAYTRHLDTVFGPAVDAWNACMAHDALRIDHKLRDTDSFVADLTWAHLPGKAAQISLTGVRPDRGVVCRDGNGTHLTEASRATLTGAAVYSVTCERVDNSADAQKVVAFTTVTSIPLLIPEKPKGPIAFDTTRTRVLTQLSSPSCDAHLYLPPHSRERELSITIAARVMDADTAAASVKIDGVEVVTSRGSKPGNNRQWNTPSVTQIYKVPANAPIHVVAAGGASGGSQNRCLYLVGDIKSSE